MLIGVVNKILDYLTQNIIEHLALTILTVWMAHDSHSAGVHVSNYKIKEELLKPWAAVVNFVKRWHSLGWRGPEGLQYSALFRFLATLIISVCFLLLGAGMNTVGIPKGRWYPNLWPKTKVNDALMTLRTPQMKNTMGPETEPLSILGSTDRLCSPSPSKDLMISRNLARRTLECLLA